MGAYIFLCIFPIFLTLLYRNVDQDPLEKKRYLFWCGIALIVIIGLRSKYVGSTDSNNYYRMMSQAINANTWDAFFVKDRVETGFQVYVWVLSRVFKDPQFLILISTAIIVSITLYSIWKNSKNVMLSVVMFTTLGLLTFEMQAMRQALAMSICLLAFEYAQNKRLIPFAVSILLATFFHRTAIVFIPIYLFSYINFSKLSMALITVGGAVFMYISKYIITVANSIFNETYYATVERGGFIAVAIYTLILVFSLLFNRRFEEQGREKNLLFVLILGAITYLMRYFGTLAAERVSFYFMFSQFLLLPNTLDQIEENNRRVMVAIVVILSILLFIYRMRTSDLVPYHFFTYGVV